MKIRLPALAAVSLLSAGTAHADYAFVLIDYPGAASTSVFGINERGDVAGFGSNGVATSYGSSPAPTSFVYKWRRDEFVEVQAAPGMPTYVLGINDGGAMVGSVNSPLGDGSAFVRSSDGTYRIFTHPQAHSHTDARAVNADGLITGFRDLSDRSSVGFLYDPAAESFADFVPSAVTIAHGINSAGQVVGSALFIENGPCPEMGDGRYGWLRDVDGTVTFFRVNGDQTDARGINDSGLIAGSATHGETVKSSDSAEGVTYREARIGKGFVVELRRDASRCQSLSVPDSLLFGFPGYDLTMPEGITNSGVVVGNVFDSDGESMHGFIATPR